MNLLNKFSDVKKYLSDVNELADKNREALGFLPQAAYLDAAYKQNIIVAIDSTSNSYLGHILFGGKHPERKLFQTVVNSKNQGVGRELVKELISISERDSYTHISAGVASDLDEAMGFYTKLGFRKVGQRDGGETKNRKINLMRYFLDTPDLFNYETKVDLSYDSNQDSKIINFRSPETDCPSFLVDVNVFLDILQDRDQKEAAQNLFAKALQAHFKLSIAAEFVNELERSAKQSNDPLLEFAKGINTVSPNENKNFESIINEVAKIVFADKVKNKKISNRDISDCKHLATAITQNKSGFITREKAILTRAKTLMDKFGIEVYSPFDFFKYEYLDNNCAQYSSTYMGNFRVDELPKIKISELKILLSELSINEVDQTQAIDEILRVDGLQGFKVSQKEKLLSLCVFSNRGNVRDTHQIFLFGNDFLAESETALKLSLSECLNFFNEKDFSHLFSKISKERFLERKVLSEAGFVHEIPKNNNYTYNKINIPLVTFNTNWQKLRNQVKSKILTLPKKPPNHSNVFEKLQCDKVKITIKDLQRLFSPLIIASKNIGGAIVPIQAKYSIELFGSNQLSLLENKIASKLSERVYFSSIRNKKILSSGKPIVFYESDKDNGRKAAIAIAQIRESRIVSTPDLITQEKAVIDNDNLDKMYDSAKLATYFENVIKFKYPVNFQTLKSNGCVDKSNLVSAQNLNYEQLKFICEKGEVCG